MSSLLTNAILDEAGGVFRALSDPSRLKLVRALMASGEAVNQHSLAAVAGLSQANTSRHLERLVQAGLVHRSRERQQVLFRLAGTMAQELCGLVRDHVLGRSRSAYASLY